MPRTRGFKWDLFIEYLIAAAAEGFVALVGWVGTKCYKAYRKRERARQRAAKKAEKD